MTQSRSSVAGPPGSVLRDARESAGKSISETAEALNLLRTYVEALEENDYSRFNSPLFARGYIKSYARYMELDVEPLLKDCDRICRRDDEQFQRSKPQGRAKAPGNARVIVALIFATLIWSVSYVLFSGPVQKELAITILEQRYPAPFELRNSTALGESLLRGRLQDGEEPMAPRADPMPAASHNVRLRLRAVDDVWLELRNVRGEALFSGTLAGGTVQHFDTTGPVDIAAAYWPALETQYNGQAVVLPRPLASNALRVRIGEL